MVSKKSKERMRDFLAERVEEAARYDIKEADNSHLLIARKLDLAENPAEVYIVLHNSRMTLNDYARLMAQNRNKRRYTAEVFYKDGETFMVRLAGRGEFKGDDRSLKRYDKETRDKMIHLRGLEKKALSSQPCNPTLIYFQPETTRLPEGLRGYEMKTVHLDYSHIRPGDPGYGFARPDTSIDYKIAEEVPELAVSEGAVGFRQVMRGSNKLLIGPKGE